MLNIIETKTLNRRAEIGLTKSQVHTKSYEWPEMENVLELPGDLPDNNWNDPWTSNGSVDPQQWIQAAVKHITLQQLHGLKIDDEAGRNGNEKIKEMGLFCHRADVVDCISLAASIASRFPWFNKHCWHWRCFEANLKLCCKFSFESFQNTSWRWGVSRSYKFSAFTNSFCNV